MTETVDLFDECSVSDALTAVAGLIRAQRENSQATLSAQQDRIQAIESKLVAELNRICGSLDEWQAVFGEIEQWHRDVASQQQQAGDTHAEAEELRLKTQRQRRALAKKFVSRRSLQHGRAAERVAQLEEQVDQLQSEIEETDAAGLDAKVTSLTQQFAQEQARSKRLENDARAAREELATSRSESGNLRQQVARGRKLLDQRSGQIKSLQAEINRLAADQGTEAQSALQERTRLREEIEQLKQQIDELELARRQSDNADNEAIEDLRSKYEMAIENVRSLTNRNEELERQLAESSAPTCATGFDWESQKEAITRSLNGDAPDGADPEVLAKLENTVKMTDKVIAQKDQEISDLKSNLQALRLAEKQPVPGPKEQESLLSADEVIARGRRELQQLKNEWREKLRVAEVDISVERAQTARARAELEEKMRDLEAQLALAKKQAAIVPAEKPAKGWFRR